MPSNDGPFELGSFVALRSGGPTMTVKSEITQADRSSNKGYWCTWFENKQLKEAAFDSVTLKQVTPPNAAAIASSISTISAWGSRK